MACKQTVIFGAGAIGLAFLGDLFDRSGYAITFLDIREDIVSALNARGGYDIHIVRRGEDRLREIRNVCALNTTDLGTDADLRESVAEAVAEAGIIFTAAGERALPAAGAILAPGLGRRAARRDRRPVNIICCENVADPAAILRDNIEKNLPADTWEKLSPRVGIARSVISRMTPVVKRLEHVTTEAYDEIPVEGAAWRGEAPDVVGLRLVDNFPAYKARKLIMHNMTHATTAYLGYFLDKSDLAESMEDPRVAAVARRAMDEAIEVMVAEFNLPRAEQEEHGRDLLARYDNPALGHTVGNVARDPIRKLGAGDRMMTAARLAERHGLPCRAITFGIALALNYDKPDDAEAGELQRRLASSGLAEVLEGVSGVRRGEPLAESVARAYECVRAAVARARREQGTRPIEVMADEFLGED